MTRIGHQSDTESDTCPNQLPLSEVSECPKSTTTREIVTYVSVLIVGAPQSDTSDTSDTHPTENAMHSTPNTPHNSRRRRLVSGVAGGLLCARNDAREAGPSVRVMGAGEGTPRSLILSSSVTALPQVRDLCRFHAPGRIVPRANALVGGCISAGLCRPAIAGGDGSDG